uniref:F-box protein GID2 n=1 Tax=Opuntia streptacantha TaxID=393608 RepID=A0A7C8Z7B9_OPUST
MRINLPFVIFENCQLVGLPQSTPSTFSLLSNSPLKISPKFSPKFRSDPQIPTMKRSMADDPELSDESESESKKVRFEEDTEDEVHTICENGFARLDENLLYEVLKHADARTLAAASCVNKTWHRTAQDERLWELSCTRHWPNINCGTERLRSVVLALGGFQRLHALYLSKTEAAPATSAVPHIPAALMPVVPQAKRGSKRWGKDEVHLSLSLLSIRYYEKMNFASRNSK